MWTKEFIKEINDWRKYNFPNQKPNEAALGILEELGELAHAHLKHIQGIRKQDYTSAKMDAIADMTIFAINLADLCDIDISTFKLSDWSFTTKDENLIIKNLSFAAASLLKETVDSYRVNALVKSTIENLFANCSHYCALNTWSYSAIVENTWNEVKQRDWIKYPIDGKTI